ncbi:hypothetical protein GALMADRAFT_154278 [Galerina marginata CBS 339.88]|uniref:Protein kinase domain-containing protein n=1 Tax=Galerina marginata (strain CBS 339.88) TaxID=685588 RepID=A0A067TAH4_GALM3|nr:hypothetical protein GALMADRAFT_154278 [Galerina marginata CBS 339.88]
MELDSPSEKLMTGSRPSSQVHNIIRQKLPSNLDIWRIPGDCVEAEEQIWKDLDEVFRDAGLILWSHLHSSVLSAPENTYPPSNGFGYVIPFRSDPQAIGGATWLRQFQCTNPLSRAARTRDGLDVIIRIIVHGKEGHDHLNILRKIATNESALYSNNHTLPMFRELQFEDVIFATWAKNSVGDIVEMLLQMLEGLAFIHEKRIAHRDAFCDNFLVQWHPESLSTMTISPSRPRVYLIDFEVAIEYPPESSKDECVCTGLPLGGSFLEAEMYSRPVAPECAPGQPYSPFKLDVWQLATSLSNVTTRIPAVDQVLVDMRHSNPLHRLDAQAALDELQKIVHSMPPISLLIEPQIIED